MSVVNNWVKAGASCTCRLWLCSELLFAEHRPLFFAEPYTGLKVESYSISLPLSRLDTREYRIPSDCSRAMTDFDAGAWHWGNPVERTMWHKVVSDCRHYAILHRFPDAPAVDHVSGYDFRHANLQDLPFNWSCLRPSVNGKQTDCQTPSDNRPDISGLVPVEYKSAERSDRQGTDCRIERGLFRGRIIIDDDGVMCEKQRFGPGFRIRSIDYADVNGDGVQDAVLRLIPIGPGGRRVPISLSVTRKEREGPFTVPMPSPQSTSADN